MPFFAILMLLAAAGAAPAGAAPPGEVCSLRAHGGARADSITLILARPRPDTVEAGAGGLEYDLAMGHSGQPVERAVFGQVVEVRRIAGPGAEESPPDPRPDTMSGRPLRRPRPRVVLVPWDYAADCSRALWPQSWRWADAYVEGLFMARLRPREHWAGGLPTYDVDRAAFQPYPWGRALRSQLARSDEHGFLSAGRLFDAYMALPSRGEIATDPDGALRRVEAWERDNAELAPLAPAPFLLGGIRYGVSAARASRIVPPIGGTYLVEVRVAEGRPVVVFLRTTARPTGALTPEDGRGVAPEGAPAWYRLHVHGAEDEESIPETHQEAARTPCSVSSLRVEHRPSAAAPGTRRWRARLDSGFASRCFRRHLGLAHAVTAVRAALAGREPYEEDGVFVQDAEGGIRFEQTVRVGGRVVMEMRGVRVSERVVSGS